MQFVLANFSSRCEYIAHRKVRTMEVTTQESKGPVVLLIENSETDVFIFRRALANAGYNGSVRTVGSATEARAYVENAYPYQDTIYFTRPELIVSDFRLAGNTAFTFVEWLRNASDLKETPIIILSGAITPIDSERMTQIGAKAVLRKSGDVTVLAEALRPFLPAAAACI